MNICKEFCPVLSEKDCVKECRIIKLRIEKAEEEKKELVEMIKEMKGCMENYIIGIDQLLQKHLEEHEE